MIGTKLHRFAISVLSVGVALVFMVCLSYSVFAQPDRTSDAVVSLPHPISCTDLEVVRLSSYSGKFYEDGSGREVLDVAALEICNTSQRLIPYAYILITTETAEYIFQATMIPPNSTVLVPETQAQGYENAAVVHIFGWTTVLQQEAPPSVKLWQTEGGYCVENFGNGVISDLTVYHRTYIPQGDISIGGMAFATSLPPILPGEKVWIRPENYAPGYRKIIYWK